MLLSVAGAYSIMLLTVPGATQSCYYAWQTYQMFDQWSQNQIKTDESETEGGLKSLLAIKRFL